MTKYAFDVVLIGDEEASRLRAVCDPSYKGPDGVLDVLPFLAPESDEMREIVIVDEGEVIYNGAL